MLAQAMNSTSATEPNKRQQRRTQLADQRLAQRSQPNANAAVGRGIGLRQAGGNGVQLDSGVFARDAGTQTSDHIGHMILAVRPLVLVQLRKRQARDRCRRDTAVRRA